LAPRVATIGDSSPELIEVVESVRDEPGAVLAYLDGLDVSRETFNQIKGTLPTDRSLRAGRFIYLNRTAWNGLYRVNSRGVFNVPYGLPKSPRLIDAGNLLACSRALATAIVRCGDFEHTFSSATIGDLVYLDPPYVTGHSGNGFVDYNENLFSWTDQVRLAAAAERAVSRGATVIVTNADHQAVTDLYRSFDKHVVKRYSTLAADKTRRTPVTEAIFVSR
jgi:DNA adenine methylase